MRIDVYEPTAHIFESCKMYINIKNCYIYNHPQVEIMGGKCTNVIVLAMIREPPSCGLSIKEEGLNLNCKDTSFSLLCLKVRLA